MSEEEFIKFQPDYSAALREILMIRFREAILTFAFSKDPMALTSPKLLLANLIKYELAKGIFFHFLNTLNSNIEYTDNEVQSVSKIDYCTDTFAWTLIHHFIRIGVTKESLKLHQLPALISNSLENDLWSGRREGAGSKKRIFIFTFMDESDMKGILAVVENKISPEALTFLTGLNRNYQTGNGDSIGFSKMDILKRFNEKTTSPNFHFQKMPTLYIAGIAGNKEFNFFADTDDNQAHAYSMYTGRYYDHHPNGGLSFLNGTLITKFKNATCPMEALPAFKGFVE